MNEWEISRTSGQCSGTGESIEPGCEYFAALVQTEEGLTRRDFSANYWDNSKPEVYCYWKTKQPDPDQKKQIFIDDAMLMSFFERLEEETDQEKINFRFVLTLILMRKRKLKYDSSQDRSGKDIWRLRIVGGDKGFVEVENPELTEEQVEQLSSQVGEILQVEL